MYLIVVGAEPERLHLIDFATRDGYEITLIEPNQDKARKALKHYDIRVLHGSFTPAKTTTAQHPVARLSASTTLAAAGHRLCGRLARANLVC